MSRAGDPAFVDSQLSVTVRSGDSFDINMDDELGFRSIHCPFGHSVPDATGETKLAGFLQFVAVTYDVAASVQAFSAHPGHLACIGAFGVAHTRCGCALAPGKYELPGLPAMLPSLRESKRRWPIQKHPHENKYAYNLSSELCLVRGGGRETEDARRPCLVTTSCLGTLVSPHVAIVVPSVYSGYCPTLCIVTTMASNLAPPCTLFRPRFTGSTAPWAILLIPHYYGQNLTCWCRVFLCAGESWRYYSSTVESSYAQHFRSVVHALMVHTRQDDSVKRT